MAITHWLTQKEELANTQYNCYRTLDDNLLQNLDVGLFEGLVNLTFL